VITGGRYNMATTKRPRPEEHPASGERTCAETAEENAKFGDLQLEEDELPQDEDEDLDDEEEDEDVDDEA
jgi:hypothetical protein